MGSISISASLKKTEDNNKKKNHNFHLEMLCFTRTEGFSGNNTGLVITF